MYRTLPTSTFLFFFFNDTATTEIYTLSLHDALPILNQPHVRSRARRAGLDSHTRDEVVDGARHRIDRNRSEEHTSELQSLAYLVCRLLLEKKKNRPHVTRPPSWTQRNVIQVCECTSA